MDAKKEEDRDENELVQQVKPLLEQAEKILNETQCVIKGELRKLPSVGVVY